MRAPGGATSQVPRMHPQPQAGGHAPCRWLVLELLLVLVSSTSLSTTAPPPKQPTPTLQVAGVGAVEAANHQQHVDALGGALPVHKIVHRVLPFLQSQSGKKGQGTRISSPGYGWSNSTLQLATVNTQLKGKTEAEHTAWGIFKGSLPLPGKMLDAGHPALQCDLGRLPSAAHGQPQQCKTRIVERRTTTPQHRTTAPPTWVASQMVSITMNRVLSSAGPYLTSIVRSSSLPIASVSPCAPRTCAPPRVVDGHHSTQ